jgi:hypothetical protein
MKLLVTAAAAAALTLVAGSAFCAEPVTAKLQTPVKSRVRFVAAETVFDCTGDTCTTDSDESGAQSVSTCRAIAREVGTVTAFGRASKLLAADRLAACNVAAKH